MLELALGVVARPADYYIKNSIQLLRNQRRTGL